MKKLISAIPTKTIRIHGHSYEVYEPVRITATIFKDSGYKQDRLEVSFGGLYKTWSITPFKRCVEPVRAYLCRQNDQRIVNEANRFVELNYSPREYTFSPSSGINVISIPSKRDPEEYVITVRVMNSNTAEERYSYFDVGIDGYVTEEQIQSALDKAIEHRIVVCNELNEAARENREAFRRLVNQQLAARDNT